MKKSLLLILISCGLMSARAAVLHYVVALDGPSEFPANASPGTGVGTASYDPAAHTLQLQVAFSGLLGNTTASHIHAPTANPFALTNNAGVATTTPTFAGFPLGVTSGTYSNTLNLTLSSSYNPAFVTANGGTTAGAEAALTAAIAAGKAYWNIHSTAFPGGEIRGFLVAHDEAPVIHSVRGAPERLWPPNHKMVPVTVSVTATDDFGPTVCEIISVTNNEPSSGPGNHDPDWEITGPLTVNLRSERLGQGSGRIYTITVQCEDDGGNQVTADVTVPVPKSMGK
jgi:hypothetical protein